MELAAELASLRERWNGLYSITLLDDVWSAQWIRSGEEIQASTVKALSRLVNRDYQRRLELRPGAPERMST
jgi:hypothetical protein